MMFPDEIVLSNGDRGEVEEDLQRWRFAMERNGMRVNRSKSEHPCVNETERNNTVNMERNELKEVTEFKYLGSTINNEGGNMT